MDEREIYTDSSDGEDLAGGAHGGYVAQLVEGQMPVNFEEYLSDESTDTSYTMCNYRTQRTPPTPPRPRPSKEEGTFWVIVDHDEDINLSTYFSDVNLMSGRTKKTQKNMERISITRVMIFTYQMTSHQCHTVITLWT